jgi:hypothetical protein
MVAWGTLAQSQHLGGVLNRVSSFSYFINNKKVYSSKNYDLGWDVMCDISVWPLFVYIPLLIKGEIIICNIW